MKQRLLAVLAVLACCAAGPARASVCEASFQIEGHKATRWFDLGEVAGAKRKENCLVKAKNHLGNAKLDELGFSKKVCARLPAEVAVFTRVDSKARPAAPDAVVKTDLPEACPDAAPAKGKAPREDKRDKAD